MRFRLESRYNDYDSKGHVNNAVFLTYFEIAREKAWVNGLGRGDDPPFILAEATIRYVSQARLGEALDIEVSTTSVRSKAWVWNYRVIAASDERVVAEGSTVQVMFDYETRRSIEIPEDLRAALPSI